MIGLTSRRSQPDFKLTHYRLLPQLDREVSMDMLRILVGNTFFI
jgi:hypothetical protein